MNKSLIISEKPSVAMEFAKVLKITGKKDGYIEGDKYVITWCVGHLIEMLYPDAYDEKYKKWTLEDLPFLPKTYKYGIISKVKKQYQIINKMLHRSDIDTVYWAGDSGKEGQTIEENIRRYGGVRKGMKELRVWIDSQTEDEIKRGLREAKPMSDYDNLGNSGIMRAIEDYSIGINFSRALSIKYAGLLNKVAPSSKYRPIAVGRVMTCVLGLVVGREREIRDFNETPFYKIVGDFFDKQIEGEWKAISGSKYFESPLLYKDSGFKNKADAESLVNNLKGKPAFIKNISTFKTIKNPPLLFNLAELQAECSKLFKISPEETLNVVQTLYEKKLTTYPRTDARVLSKAVANNMHINLTGLKSYSDTQKFIDFIINNGPDKKISNSQYVDDSKITDHYAIIPTGVLTELSSLNPLQSKVFDLIVRRFLSIFYPAAEYENAKLEISIANETFFISDKKLLIPGYFEISGAPKNSNDSNNGKLITIAKSLKKNDAVKVSAINIKAGKTVPPKHYTSGTIILAMENAGKLIEDEDLRAQIKDIGIGTSATRAGIIQKLIDIGYLSLNKKTQVLTSEVFGELVYDVVNMTIPAMLNPKMTASWEKGLEGIANGSITVQKFSDTLNNFIIKEISSIASNDLSLKLSDSFKILKQNNQTPTHSSSMSNNNTDKPSLNCPVCGSEIIKKDWGWGCSGYQNGCSFSVSNKIAGKKITDAMASKLIKTGSMGKVTGLKGKSGKTFDTVISLNEQFKTVFVFS